MVCTICVYLVQHVKELFFILIFVKYDYLIRLTFRANREIVVVGTLKTISSYNNVSVLIKKFELAVVMEGAIELSAK